MKPHLNTDLAPALARLLPQPELGALRASLATHGLRVGDRVALVMDNTPLHAGLLLLLLSERVVPLLLAPETTQQECESQLAAFGARHALACSGTQVLSTGPAGGGGASSVADAPSGDGIVLLTSGSTGRPNRVHRPLRSWHDEARRYCSLLGLAAGHRLLVAAPLWHAYGLGWLWAAVQSGCALEILRPTELGGIASALHTRATHCALTPAIASLLSRRAVPGARPSHLDVVMAGAGPVDADLEKRFAAAFGLGLSRNYGSTESGALCAGLAPLPPLAIGSLMPHLRLAEAPASGQHEPFLLKVELEDGRIYDTGDLAMQTSEGWLSLVGREASAIRRGERWISPFEIESVLKSHPAVRDGSVRAVRSHHAGNDHVFASVVMHDGQAFDGAALRAFSGEYLSRSKLPDRFEQVPELRRNAQGKPLAPKAYQAAAPAVLLDAAVAYKRSTLLFALLETGALEALDGRKSTDQVAHEQGLHADTLARALELARCLGLVEEADTSRSAGASLDASARDIALLEHQLCRALNSAAGLAATLRNGHLAAREQATRHDDELARLYQRAMNGAHKRLSMNMIWRELTRASTLRAPLKVLDVGATDGGYSRWLHERGHLDVEGSRCTQVGCLTSNTPGPVGELALSQLQSCALRFDVLVLDNAIHHPEVVHRLPQLVDLLAEGGHLLVDEIFIEPDRPIAGIDWLTHGGVCLPTEVDLLSELSSLGFVPTARHHTPSAVPHHALLFKAKGRT